MICESISQDVQIYTAPSTVTWEAGKSLVLVILILVLSVPRTTEQRKLRIASILPRNTQASRKNRVRRCAHCAPTVRRRAGYPKIVIRRKWNANPSVLPISNVSWRLWRANSRSKIAKTPSSQQLQRAIVSHQVEIMIAVIVQTPTLSQDRACSRCHWAILPRQIASSQSFTAICVETNSHADTFLLGKIVWKYMTETGLLRWRVGIQRIGAMSVWRSPAWWLFPGPITTRWFACNTSGNILPAPAPPCIVSQPYDAIQLNVVSHLAELSAPRFPSPFLAQCRITPPVYHYSQ